MKPTFLIVMLTLLTLSCVSSDDNGDIDIISELKLLYDNSSSDTLDFTITETRLKYSEFEHYMFIGPYPNIPMIEKLTNTNMGIIRETGIEDTDHFCLIGIITHDKITEYFYLTRVNINYDKIKYKVLNRDSHLRMCKENGIYKILPPPSF